MTESSLQSKWVPQLEGIRGIAALWVLIGHACIFANFHPPIISSPIYGVDLFILISGYLMAHNYENRKEIEPWDKTNTIIIFWIRRFFRIAPLYYLILIVSMFFASSLGEMRQIVSEYSPNSATADQRYIASFGSFLSHITFIFGAIPSESFSTALPDWSIGLEMQYYLVFPFIMILTTRLRYIPAYAIIAIASISIVYALQDFAAKFGMPSWLPLKLHLFLSGMLIERYLRERRLIYLFVALSFIIFVGLFGGEAASRPRAVLAQAAIFVAMSLILSNHYSYSRFIRLTFSSKLMKVLGEVSYSVYLIHLLILIPTAAYLLPAIGEVRPSVKFLIISVISIPFTYAISYILYKYIEIPFIGHGKAVIQALNTRIGKTRCI